MPPRTTLLPRARYASAMAYARAAVFELTLIPTRSGASLSLARSTGSSSSSRNVR